MFKQFFKEDSLTPIIGKTMLLKDSVKNEIITIRYEKASSRTVIKNKTLFIKGSYLSVIKPTIQ